MKKRKLALALLSGILLTTNLTGCATVKKAFGDKTARTMGEQELEQEFQTLFLLLDDKDLEKYGVQLFINRLSNNFDDNSLNLGLGLDESVVYKAKNNEAAPPYPKVKIENKNIVPSEQLPEDLERYVELLNYIKFDKQFFDSLEVEDAGKSWETAGIDIKYVIPTNHSYVQKIKKLYSLSDNITSKLKISKDSWLDFNNNRLERYSVYLIINDRNQTIVYSYTIETEK